MFKRYALVAIELVRPVDNKLSVVNPETQKTAMDEAGKLVAFDYDAANFVYFRCRAISADDPNGNGDMFPEKELKAAYKTFVGVGMYRDHDSDSVDKSVGKVLWAEWVPEGKYVECYCCVDKVLAPDLARRIEMGEASTVSMGCGRAGTKITLRDGSLKNIEEIAVGDEVMTHVGVSSKVSHLMKRDYSDPIYKVGITGLAGMPLYITAEHPVWLVSKEQIKKVDQPEFVIAGDGRAFVSHLNKRIDAAQEYKFAWTKVEDLRVGDYVGFPFPTKTETPEYVTRDFARLAGYFLAEGNFTGGKKSRDGICLTFSINEKDTFAAESAVLIKSVFGRDARVKEFPDLKAIRVFGFSTKIAAKFYELFGSGAKTKRLHESVLYWDKSLQLELVGAFLNGDGFVTSNHKINGVREINLGYLETASQDLARQMCSLLARSGIVWNLEQKDYPEKIAKFHSGEKHIRASRTWRISFTKRYFNVLSAYSSKVPGNVPPINGRHVKFFYKNYLMSPIRSIETEDYNEPVYNFEVENQNSYLMNGFAVHNCMVGEAECSACGNIAHNAMELCFVPGTQITMSDGSAKSIESIFTGDAVITASGSVRNVSKLFSRNISERIVRMRVETKQDPIYVTCNHPMLALKSSEFKSTIVLMPPEYVDAGKLKAGDFLFTPTVSYESESVLTPEKMRWLGWYASEGHIQTNGSSSNVVGFTLGSHEPQFVDEICALSESSWGRRPRVYSNRGPNGTSTSINLSSHTAADFAVKHIGRGAKTKKFSFEVMSAPVEAQKEFLASYILGDGYVRHGKTMKNRGLASDTVSIATASKAMAEQLCVISERCGISARMHRVKQQAGPAKRALGQTIDSVLYHIYLRPSDIGQISGNLSKYFVLSPSKRSSGRGRLPYNGGWISRIKSVDFEDYSGIVHNFEVNEEHTYVAGGVAVHNCDHMVPGRGIKGKRNHEGKIAYEINRLLQFTELSLVTVPADPTAKIFEVYAAHKAGKISDEQLRQIIASEMNGLLATLTAPLQKSGANVSASTAATQHIIAPAAIEATKASAPVEVVVRNKDLQQEERMKLAIQYQRGPALTSSFFVAKEADAVYRVCAADVLPLLVQEAIVANEPGVATPDQIIADLSSKCASLGDFKVWAKKRKKKNRRAVEKRDDGEREEHEEGETAKDNEDKKDLPTEHFMANEKKKADVAAAPAMTMPASPTPGMESSSVDLPPASMDLHTDDSSEGGDAHTNPADGGPAGEASVEELQEAIHEMQNLLKNKMSSAKSPAKVATKCENPTEHRDKGDESGKTSPAKDPKAEQEIKSTENTKGHIDKGASMNKTAINEDWSMNPKELEKTPKQPKSEQAAPSVVSWEHKEMQSEEVKHEKGGDNAAGGKIKKFYGRLPSGGAGDAPLSMDLKSGVEETIMLKKALAAEKAKRIALETKESTAALVDKIADIVTTLSEKNLITAGKEEETIKLLSGWKDLAILDGVHSLVSSLSVRQAEAAAPAGADEVMVGNDAPQVFESVSNSDDAITMMSKIWNA